MRGLFRDEVVRGPQCAACSWQWGRAE